MRGQSTVVGLFKDQLCRDVSLDLIDGTVRVGIRILQLVSVLAAVGGAPNRIRARAGQRSERTFLPPFFLLVFLSIEEK